MAMSPRFPLLKWIVPAVVLVATSGFVPSRADARCGDYVMLGSHGSRGDHSSRMVGMPDAGAGSSSHAADDVADRGDAPPTPRRQGPCSGPQCSGETPRPLGTPTAPHKILMRDWAVLASVCDPAALESRFKAFEDAPLAPSAIRSSIFRPPR